MTGPKKGVKSYVIPGGNDEVGIRRGAGETGLGGRG